jgi:ferredoxin-like protein FixX
VIGDQDVIKGGRASMADTKDMTNFKIKDFVFRNDADPGDFITFDEAKCIGCGLCVTICTVNLWSMGKARGGKAHLSPKYKELCMECAGCYAMCEADAIDFRYPNGGAGIIIKHG